MAEKYVSSKCLSGKGSNRNHGIYMDSWHSLIIVSRNISYGVFHGQGFYLLNYCSKGSGAEWQGVLSFDKRGTAYTH